MTTGGGILHIYLSAESSMVHQPSKKLYVGGAFADEKAGEFANVPSSNLRII
jgi:hypothetical protein